MENLTEKQKEIINTATEIICIKGIQNLTMRNLAGALSITEPAIYRHFESKNDLILKIVGYIARNWNRVIHAVKNPELPALDELKTMLQAVVDYFEKNRFFSHTLFSLGSIVNNPELMHAVREIEELGKTELKDMIQRAQNEGDIRTDISSEQIAELILSIIERLLSQWIFNIDDFDLKSNWIEMWKLVHAIVREK
jgi:AcrR family transcriptional regulator